MSFWVCLNYKIGAFGYYIGSSKFTLLEIIIEKKLTFKFTTLIFMPSIKTMLQTSTVMIQNITSTEKYQCLIVVCFVTVFFS